MKNKLRDYQRKKSLFIEKMGQFKL